MLAYYMHNLTPKIFEIYGFGPRWYGFSYLLGFVCAYFLVMKLSRQGILKVPTEKVPDMVLMFCIFGVLIGGRMGYVLFYDLPEALKNNATPLLWDFSSSLPFWGVLRVNQGGMSAHGGVVGTVLAILLYSWRNKVDPINVGDASCMVVPVGLFFGRIANFINGELYGHITNVAWAVQFPTEMRMPPPTPGEHTVDPGKVNEVISQVLQQHPDLQRQIIENHDRYHDVLTQYFQSSPADQYRLLEKNPDLPSVIHNDGVDALINMVQHGNQQVADLLRPILPVRHPSQLYEALLEGLLLFIICWTIGQLWRKRGMASGAFLTFYPVMRIIGEQFRVGDTPVDIMGMSVAKGVLYSVPMFLVGLGFWIYFMTRPETQKSEMQNAKCKMQKN